MISVLIIIILQIIQKLLPQSLDNVNLACGLFAFIGIAPEKYFSWDKFNILGLYNDSRGGDACGRVFGNTIQHGIDTMDTYKDFIVETPNPKLKKYPYTILGHCRKASSGGKNEIYAQPLVLRRKDINMKAFKDTQFKHLIKDLPGETIICSGIHNGTIENYKELAPTYGIPIEDHNDSKVLLNALFYNNFEILSLYIGTASIIWQNHITGKTFVFHGASKVSSYSEKMSEERPLYAYEIGKNNFYISSIKEPLRAIGASEKTIRGIGFNTVGVFKDGIRIKTIKINREDATQGKYDYSISSRKPIGFRSHFMDTDRYNESSFYQGSFHVGGKNPLQLALPIINNHIPKDLKKLNKSIIVTGEGTKNPFVRYFDTFAEPFRLQAEICDQYNSPSVRRAIFNKGRYWMNGNLMHGIYLLNGVGMVPNRVLVESSTIKPYFFVEGIIMDGITGYNKAIQIHEEFMIALTNNIALLSEEEQCFTSSIIKYSRYPTVSLTRTIGEQDCFDSMSSEEDGSNFYDGTFHPLFSDREYSFKNGDLFDIKVSKNNLKTADHDEDDGILSETYLKTCRMDMSKDETFKIGMRLLIIGGLTNPFSPFQNVMFGFTDLDDSIEIQAMLIHYLRDFRNDIKTACCVCVNRTNTLINMCVKCSNCKEELEKIVKVVDYAVFK